MMVSFNLPRSYSCVRQKRLLRRHYAGSVSRTALLSAPILATHNHNQTRSIHGAGARFASRTGGCGMWEFMGTATSSLDTVATEDSYY